jgi:hypothetical protein
MKLRFTTVITAFSLVLSCVSVYWWMRSGDRLTVASLDRPGGTSYQLWGCNGKLALLRTHRPAIGKSLSGNEHLTWGTMPYDPHGESALSPKLMWTSFSYGTRPLADPPGGTESSLIVPVWALTTAFAVAPTLWVMSRIRPRRAKGGS